MITQRFFPNPFSHSVTIFPGLNLAISRILLEQNQIWSAHFLDRCLLFHLPLHPRVLIGEKWVEPLRVGPGIEVGGMILQKIIPWLKMVWQPVPHYHLEAFIYLHKKFFPLSTVYYCYYHCIFCLCYFYAFIISFSPIGDVLHNGSKCKRKTIRKQKRSN